MLPAGFHVNSNEFRPIPGPELTGSGWLCREQRVVLLSLALLSLVGSVGGSGLVLLLLLVVVVVLLAA